MTTRSTISATISRRDYLDRDRNGCACARDQDERAGSTTPDADRSALNKAAALRDGAHVYVPRYGEIPPAGIGRELESLPGIGPSTAARIVGAAS